MTWPYQRCTRIAAPSQPLWQARRFIFIGNPSGFVKKGEGFFSGAAPPDPRFVFTTAASAAPTLTSEETPMIYRGAVSCATIVCQ
jgi:hypothetical protein